MKKYLLLLLCVMLLAACSKGGDVVAKVDGEKITTTDVEKKINAMPPPYREYFKQPEAMAAFVDQLANEELIYVAAKKKGMDKDEDYKQAVEDFKRRTLITRLLKKELPPMPQLTEKDVKAYYDSHKADLINITAVRVSQIVVKNEADAKKVYDRLQKGEAFAKIAAEVSVDKATAKAGGDMGFVPANRIDPEIGKVLSQLKKNEVSPTPALMKDGLHIVVITDFRGTPLDYNKIKGALGQKLVASKQQEIVEKYLSGLKKEYKVEINKDNFSKIKIETPAPAAPAKAAAPAPEKK